MRRSITRAAVGLMLAAALGLTAGCTSSAPPSAEAATAPTAPAEASLSITPGSGSVDVPPGAPVAVVAQDATLVSVQVRDSRGRSLAGAVDAAGQVWNATGRLRMREQYRVEAVARAKDGSRVEQSAFFATLAPRKELETAISPLSGSVTGVGMPIVVRFNAPVRERAAVERALVVESAKPIEGAWSWLSDTEVHFRPREYWPAYNDITLRVNLKGVPAGRGVWGLRNRTVSFRTGAKMVSVVNVDRKTLTVTRNDKQLRVIPVSTGKAGFLTRNGTKVILEKHVLKIMDARTIGILPGDPEYYRLDVPYAMRVTWSGEFVHSAPWSVGSQGRANVSHGCVGMSPANAVWLFRQSRVGDLVTVVGSPRPLEPGNGYTDWNVSWQDWLAGSALQG